MSLQPVSMPIQQTAASPKNAPPVEAQQTLVSTVDRLELSPQSRDSECKKPSSLKAAAPWFPLLGAAIGILSVAVIPAELAVLVPLAMLVGFMGGLAALLAAKRS